MSQVILFEYSPHFSPLISIPSISYVYTTFNLECAFTFIQISRFSDGKHSRGYRTCPGTKGNQ